MMNVVAVGAVGAPFGRVSHPGGRHPESRRWDQVSCDIFDHQRGAGCHLVTLQQFMIAGERRFGLVSRRLDIEDAAERPGDAEMVEKALSVPTGTIGDRKS